jgi:Uma2 family endonuclease
VSITILDPAEARAARRRLRNTDERFTECWNGREVVPPLPNRQHQRLAFRFGPPLYETVEVPGRGETYLGVNVSDRADKWRKNYRGPDVAVYLTGNPAVPHENHMQGGPDFLVEILSRGEQPKAKFQFYAKIGTREVLLVHRRREWALELFQLRTGKLELAGRSDLTAPAVLTSSTLSLTFQLVARPDRPHIQVEDPADGRTWLV